MAHPITRSMRLISVVGLTAGGIALDLEQGKQGQGEVGVQAVKLSFINNNIFSFLRTENEALIPSESSTLRQERWVADAKAANAAADAFAAKKEAERVAAAEIAAVEATIKDELREPGCDFLMHNYIISRDGSDGFHEYLYYQYPDQIMHNSRTSVVLSQVYPKREDVPLIQDKELYRRKMIFSFASNFRCVEKIEALVRDHNLFPLDQRSALEDLGKSEVERKPAFMYLMKRFDDEMEMRNAEAERAAVAEKVSKGRGKYHEMYQVLEDYANTSIPAGSDLNPEQMQLRWSFDNAIRELLFEKAMYGFLDWSDLDSLRDVDSHSLSGVVVEGLTNDYKVTGREDRKLIMQKCREFVNSKIAAEKESKHK